MVNSFYNTATAGKYDMLGWIMLIMLGYFDLSTLL